MIPMSAWRLDWVILTFGLKKSLDSELLTAQFHSLNKYFLAPIAYRRIVKTSVAPIVLAGVPVRFIGQSLEVDAGRLSMTQDEWSLNSKLLILKNRTELQHISRAIAFNVDFV